jgi:CRISPR-associated protein Cas6
MWIEDEDSNVKRITDDVIDLNFSINCKALPLDHAQALNDVMLDILPWLKDEAHVGVHLVHGAESGNGWQRPEEGLLYLSKRTKFSLRLPQSRLEEVKETLIGQTLDIMGYPMLMGKTTQKLLSDADVLFSRYIVTPENTSEDDFVKQMVMQMRDIGINCRKVMPGRSHRFNMASGTVFTRSLMVADLLLDDAIQLQQQGLGKGRLHGCGLFVAHKGIKAVGKAQAESDA